MKASVYFYIILVVNVALMLIPTWSGSPIPVDELRHTTITIANFVNLICGVAILLSRRNQDKSLTLFLAILFIFAFLSIVINYKFNSLKTWAISFVVYIVLFCHHLDTDFNPKVVKYVIYAIILWAALPVVAFPFVPFNVKMWMQSADVIDRVSTFSGFSMHRNYYGYFASLSLILIWITPYIEKTKYKLLLSLPIFIGLVFSSSRSSILAFLLPLFYYFLCQNKKVSTTRKVSYFMVLCLAIYGFVKLGQNYDLRYLSDTTSGRRDEYIRYFFDIFKSNVLFGIGGDAVVTSGALPEGSPCHNFIIQTAADYGIIVLILFVVFIIRSFIRSSVDSKTIWLHILIIGLFQPYFSFRIPNQFIIVSYLFIVIFSSKLNLTSNKQNEIQ